MKVSKMINKKWTLLSGMILLICLILLGVPAMASSVTTVNGTIPPAPTVTGISPSSGPTRGGTSVTITGTGFVSGATVTIGGNAATGVTFGSATSITAITPAGTAGARNVVVTNPNGQFGTLLGGFTYYLPASGGGEGTTPPIAGVGITQTGPSGFFTAFTGSYTLAVTNTREIVLNDVTVTDYLPELLSYKSSVPAGMVTGNQVTWNLGTLNIGETKKIIAILSGVKAGTAVNTVTVTTREGVTWTYSLNITVLGALGATMSLNDTKDPVAVGEELAYNIQVTNQSGTSDIHNLTMAGLIPSQMVYVSATGDSEFTVVGQEVRFSPIAQLKPEENIQYQVRVKAIAAGAAVFKATMRWDEFSESIIDEEGTTVFQPEPAAIYPPLPPATVPPQASITEVVPPPGAAPANLPAPSGIQNYMKIWLILAILIVIVAVVYFIFFILIRKRKYHPTKHQKRQAELAGAIAREMNLSKKLVKMLLMFGILHGTGSVEWPYPVARTALQYHERLNGAGYPQKLTGDNILLEARILAVADTVETMSSPKPDRPEIGLAKTLEEIKQNSSVLYNSEVVQALVRLVERGKFKFQTLYN